MRVVIVRKLPIRKEVVYTNKRDYPSGSAPGPKLHNLLPIYGGRRRGGSSMADSPAGKLGEAVAHRGACSLSVGDGGESRNGGVPVSGCGDDTGATSEKGHRARETRLGRLPIYKSLTNTASTFRPIQPKKPAVEETVWRGHAEAIARSLPRRLPRGGLRSSRARKSHNLVNSGSSMQRQSRSPFPRPLLPRERGDRGAVDSDRPLLHRPFLPQERGPEGDGQGDKAVAGDVLGVRSKEGPMLRAIQPKDTTFQDLRRTAQLAASIAWGLPKLHRGPVRRPRAEVGVDDGAAEPANASLSEQRQPQRRWKRDRLPSRDERPRKQVRSGIGRQKRRELQAEDLGTVLRFLEEDFAIKERLSNDQTWCMPIHERMVSMVRDFYQAFHDASTLPIRTCMVCYRKCTREELREITWDRWQSSYVPKGGRSPFSCPSCFAEGESVSVCAECGRCLARGGVSPAVHLHGRLGCEHMFPDELKGLTSVEEKLISLNSCYGFVTSYSIPGGQRQSVRYPRHVKSHITVFPNNVQELATKVLPHPLVRVMDEIHVSWQGSEKPGQSDLSSLLSVRRRVVERALVWLKKNNPHYAEIEIDVPEMESWGAPPHGVPSLVYDRMERNEPTAWEKTGTAQVVPPTERGVDDEGSVEIDEILTALHQGEDSPRCETDRRGENEAYECRRESDAEPDQTVKPINEATSSGMFALDGPPDVADADKLRFVCDAVGEGARNGHRGPRTWLGSSTEGRRGHVDGSEPYVHVRRGDDFADRFETSFFAKTFPTLLPFGVGGPRPVEEAGLESGRSPADMLGAEAAGRPRAELEGSGKSTDEGVTELLRSLSLYGYRQPMSRELRLSMWHKIQARIVRYGVPAIWFTINPNDLTNPIKLRLAAYRTREPEAAEEFLRSLDMSFKRIQLSITDPMSSAIFFHREMTLFFEHYVKVGKESVFGRISQYYGAVETNERGALHVHGLLWLHGNAHLSSMVADVDGEDQAAYRERIVQYIDSVFCEDLDQEGYCVVQGERSVTSDISSVIDNPEQFSAAFDEEANFCAGATQIHTHSPTCVKYSLGKKRPKGGLCRFGAPWRLVEKTAFTPEGLLQIRRTHPMVNRDAAEDHGPRLLCHELRTKVEDPTWKRVAVAAELLPVLSGGGQPAAGEHAGGDSVADDDGTKNKTRQFLMRVANRIFTERPLSQVEVVAHLLGYPSEFTNSSAWGYLNVSVLYWYVFRRWRHLRRESGTADVESLMDESIVVEEAGQRISFAEAYHHRGDVLRGLCLYDYVSLVRLQRVGNDGGSGAWGEVPFEIGWAPGLGPGAQVPGQARHRLS
ncbi:hypothetical protein HIM_10729 [Hirsutella minnesotensis 3608]|uniref:Uncharacterized protein n=1 Tax=Hirsutella minnesotensis 3608 TaxID=1043627 RepID=A0A0F8A1Z2_9HYPO|nr:hypothetical protein HIM_10729 [Hirsutella minnesotensis 3608]